MFREELSGHFYECFEYYMVLKEHFDTLIFLVHGYDKDVFMTAIKDKYDLSKDELIELNENLIVETHRGFFEKNIYQKLASKVFFYVELYDYNDLLDSNQVILTNHIAGFRCAEDLYRVDNHSRKIHILQDTRIYNNTYSNHYTYHYVKKILFDRFNLIEKRNLDNSAWIYMPPGARIQSEEYVYDVINKYSFFDKYILLSSLKIDHPKIECYDKHVPFVFENFDTYIYGPVSRKFDCSSRIITECAYFGKNIIFNIDYEDEGLKWRRKDIETGVHTLTLEENDEIIKIIRGILNAK